MVHGLGCIFKYKKKTSIRDIGCFVILNDQDLKSEHTHLVHLYGSNNAIVL